MDQHRNNRKAWLFLTQFAAEHSQAALLNTVTQRFVRTHPHFWLAWLLRAKCVQQQASSVDARRVYNAACSQIKLVSVQQTEIHVTQVLDADEIIAQELPSDAAVLFLNWLQMELSFLKQMLGDTKLSEIDDPAMRALADGQIVQHVFFKALKFLERVDFRGRASSREELLKAF